MKRIITILFLMSAAVLTLAQTPISKTFPVKQGQKIAFHFDYPELIKITTWDKNEISIQGTVSINAGENDDEFKLESTVDEGRISITGDIPNLKNLPQRIVVTHNGKKVSFRSKSDFKKYQQENGTHFSSMSSGSDVEIQLEIKVPANVATEIKSVYGMIEVRNFSGPLSAEATYGGIDASLAEKNTGVLRAETNYGQIYTNLELKISGSEVRDFHTAISAKLGAGPDFSFESKYGNVYLRKQ